MQYRLLLQLPTTDTFGRALVSMKQLAKANCFPSHSFVLERVVLSSFNWNRLSFCNGNKFLNVATCSNKLLPSPPSSSFGEGRGLGGGSCCSYLLTFSLDLSLLSPLSSSLFLFFYVALFPLSIY